MTNHWEGRRGLQKYPVCLFELRGLKKIIRMETLCKLQQVIHICAKLLQYFPTLCNPMDCSPPGSSVHGILQAKILGCNAISSSRRSSSTQGSKRHLLCLLHWQAGVLFFFLTTSITWKSSLQWFFLY